MSLVYIGEPLNKVLVYAENEAKALGDEYVSVEHLFLKMRIIFRISESLPITGSSFCCLALSTRSYPYLLLIWVLLSLARSIGGSLKNG